MLRTAIVGLGEVAAWHRQGLADTPGARLTAVADLAEERRERYATGWDVDAYPDLDALLAGADVDWVHVCTPAQTHADLTLECIDAGLDVLVEKPFVLDRESYEAVTAAADDAGVRVTPVHNQAYYAPFRRALRRVRSGEFGSLHGVTVEWSEDIDPTRPDRGEWVLDLPGGEFGEGIVHPIYVGLRAAGHPASEGDVAVHTRDDPAVDFDGIGVSFNTVSGTLCTIQHHAGTPDRRRVTFSAAAGHVTVDIATQSVRVQRESFGPNATSDRPGLAAGRDALRSGVERAARALRTSARSLVSSAYDPHDTHTAVIRREARALRGRGPGPTPRAEADWTNRIYTRLVE